MRGRRRKDNRLSIRALVVLAILQEPALTLTAWEVLDRAKVEGVDERDHWRLALANLERSGRVMVVGWKGRRHPVYVITDLGRQTLAARAA